MNLSVLLGLAVIASISHSTLRKLSGVVLTGSVTRITLPRSRLCATQVVSNFFQVSW